MSPTRGRTELQKQVAEIIRRLALSEDEIRKLPGNYDDAIRAHLFPTACDSADPQPRSFPLTFSIPRDCGYVLAKRTDALLLLTTYCRIFPWKVNLPSLLSSTRRKSEHTGVISQNSVIFRRRGGANRLAGLVPYPEPPQFPIGTRMALARQMVLIDSNGNPDRTELTESVQMRVYRAIHFDLGGTGTHSQDFFELRMSRERLLSEQAGGLRAVALGEKEFGVFHSRGIDIFES